MKFILKKLNGSDKFDFLSDRTNTNYYVIRKSELIKKQMKMCHKNCYVIGAQNYELYHYHFGVQVIELINIEYIKLIGMEIENSYTPVSQEIFHHLYMRG